MGYLSNAPVCLMCRWIYANPDHMQIRTRANRTKIESDENVTTSTYHRAAAKSFDCDLKILFWWSSLSPKFNFNFNSKFTLKLEFESEDELQNTNLRSKRLFRGSTVINAQVNVFIRVDLCFVLVRQPLKKNLQIRICI